MMGNSLERKAQLRILVTKYDGGKARESGTSLNVW